MLRIIVYAALIAGIVAFARHYGAQDAVFETGFMRPPTFFPQAVAIVAIGVLSTQLNGNLVYITPAVFLALMAGGALMAMRGLRVPEIQGGVALSVLVLGLVVALLPKPESWVALILAALFGVVHGYRIVVGGPNLPRTEIFFAGFLLASAALILGGMLLRELLDRFGRPMQGRTLIGGSIFGIGLHMMLINYQLI